MTDTREVHEGGCLCGAVRFRVDGPLRGAINCHCGQCARTHGHYASYSNAANTDLTLSGGGDITWYNASPDARRGFCRVCGSQLFWGALGADPTSIAAGALDQPSGIETIGHIYVADKADYYEIADDLPQFPGSSEGKLDGDVSV